MDQATFFSIYHSIDDPKKRVSLIKQVSMSGHVSGYLEPLVGDATCFDMINVQDSHMTNERGLKIISDIEVLKTDISKLLSLTIKSIKYGPKE